MIRRRPALVTRSAAAPLLPDRIGDDLRAAVDAETRAEFDNCRSHQARLQALLEAARARLACPASAEWPTHAD